MAETAIFTGGAEAVGGGADWEAVKVFPVLDGFGNPVAYQGYSNWQSGVSFTGPEGPPIPYGENLEVPVSSSLASNETFAALDIELVGGAFTDYGTINASTLTLDTGASMALEPAAELSLTGNIALEPTTELTVESQITAPDGSFMGSNSFDSQLQIGPTGSLTIGSQTGGSFTLTSPSDLKFIDQGQLDVAGNFTLQAHDGTVSILQGTLKVDQHPTAAGTSVIDNAQGTVNVNAASIVVGANGAPTSTLQLGSTDDTTVVELTASSITSYGHIDNQAALDASGDSRIGGGGDYLNDGSGAMTSISDGILSFQSAGKTTTVAASSAGTFKIGASGTLDLAANTNVGGATVQFDGSAAVLAVESGIGDFSSAVSGFSGTDELKVEGSDITSASFDGAHTVHVVEAGGKTLDFTDMAIAGRSAGALTISNDGDNGYVLVCYLAGTKILTAAGEVAIEELRPGDLVASRGRGLRPVAWIGRQSFVAPFLPATAIPVCIHKNALAPNVPRQDLFVSPAHAILVNDMLVLASLLVNGVTVTQQRTSDRVDYFHVDLGEHDCVLANGAWAESYAEQHNRGMFHNSVQFAQCFPDHEPTWQPFCLPHISRADDPRLSSVTASLRQRLPPEATVRDCDLHMVADGVRIDPHTASKGQWTFVLPAGVRTLLLDSHATMPRLIENSMDDRPLGVCLFGIRVLRAHSETIVSLNDSRLDDGFHAVEHGQQGDSWRWTNGSAVLPAEVFADPAVETRVVIAGRSLSDYLVMAKSPTARAA